MPSRIDERSPPSYSRSSPQSGIFRAIAPPLSLRAGQAGWSARAGHFPERHRETHRTVARRSHAPQSRRRFHCAPVKPVEAPARVFPERHRGTHRAVTRRGQAPQSRPAFIARRSSRLKRLRRPSLSGIVERTGRSLVAVKRCNRAALSLRAGQAGWSACAGHFSAPHRGTLNSVVWLGQAPQSRPAFVARRSSRLERLRRSFR